MGGLRVVPDSPRPMSYAEAVQPALEGIQVTLRRLPVDHLDRSVLERMFRHLAACSQRPLAEVRPANVRSRAPVRTALPPRG
jgi:hypothetical protein